MKRLIAATALALALGCEPSEYAPLRKTAGLTGTLELESDRRGSAWLFLFEPEQGFPLTPALPQYATAVSDVRRQTGDARFLFPEVAPNPWRLWGFVDADGNFDPTIDVLSQPTFGDWLGQGIELNLQPGKTAETSLRFDGRMEVDPPAFRLADNTASITLDNPLGAPTAIHLIPFDANGRLSKAAQGFMVGLRDSDHDGRPDDADGDGLPDLTLQGALRFRPGPGQEQEGVDVLIPLALANAAAVAQSVSAARPFVWLDRLDWFVLPQAIERRVRPGQADAIALLPMPPAGEYELVLLTTQGTLWRLPNDLGLNEASQNVRFHFDRRGG